MLVFNETSDVGSDCTATYSVTFNGKLTVDEFINEILKRGEWGCIEISEYKNNLKPRCYNYKNNKLWRKISKKVLNSYIKEIHAHGGWSLMNYVVII